MVQGLQEVVEQMQNLNTGQIAMDLTLLKTTVTEAMATDHQQ
jgi:prephenate dehydrogenase